MATTQPKEKLSRLTQFYCTPSLYDEAQKAAAELGLELSAFIRMSLTKEIRRVNEDRGRTRS